MGLFPGLRLIERLPDGRPLAEFVGGELDGRLVVLQGWEVDFGGAFQFTHRPARAPRREREGPTPSQRAEQLLYSLLDDRQRAGWRARRQFWVHTSLGDFLFGTLYDIRFRPDRDPRNEYSICVVPEGWDEGRRRPFPIADLWANLLLVLRHDPGGFLRRANILGHRDLRGSEGQPPAPVVHQLSLAQTP